MGKQPGSPVAAGLGLVLASVLATTPPLPAQSVKPAGKADRPAKKAASPAKKADPPAVDSEEGASAPSDEEPSPTPRPGGLRMSRAVVCRTIKGYEDYEPLKDAAQTSEEKLLIYYRPLRYKVDFVDGYYRAHVIQDNEIRRRGERRIIREKRKVVEYAPKTRMPPGPIYIRNMISLKGLRPGDYELTMILHDELDKGSPPSKQVVKFKVIPPLDPRTRMPAKSAESPPPEP
jgi:hypothetical protein